MSTIPGRRSHISVIQYVVKHYIIISSYLQLLSQYENTELSLKHSIDDNARQYKKDMKQHSLYYENKMLEEKGRLSQALHDKLGHSINGSLYQLEAAKAILYKKPEQSETILQAVITELRTSMDEIWAILRKEKPDKKRMTLLQLQSLCQECETKYDIEARLVTSGDTSQIPEQIWEIILDNAFEAVSNALKYAKCTKITITIAALEALVRCNITDNGVGCNNVIM